MAIPHARPGEVIDVKPLGTGLAAARSHALFKSGELELIRLVLLAGEQMPPHAVTGEITLQCIEGRIALSCDAGMRELGPGQLIRITGGEVHSLRAIEDASLLLTIALRNPAASAIPA
ncbi:MAG: cupin domain-containing protein [Ramlibacter sp.]